MRNKTSLPLIELSARLIRQNAEFEIFAIGVGTQIYESILAKVASAPYAEHVFLMKDFKDLERIGKIISGEIDYTKCGISGNTELKRGGRTNKVAYPWLGWITALLYTEEQISCGGTLLCDKWFVTLASCVTEQTENGFQTLEGRINLYLGDHDIFRKDNTEIMLEISEVHIHPNYTGEVNRHNVRPFDIALLKIGKDNTTRPQLNKFIRPICFLESRNNQDYMKGSLFLSMLKVDSQRLKGEVAGWGHRGHDSFSSKEYFPWQSLEQAKREIRRDEICNRKFPGLDTDMFFCVGNIYEKESKPCHGDIGGPLMGEALSRLYAVLGLALKTKGCRDIYDFSIFLNVFHLEINLWVERLLRGCNRINEFIPYVEEDQINTNEKEEEEGRKKKQQLVCNMAENKEKEEEKKEKAVKKKRKKKKKMFVKGFARTLEGKFISSRYASVSVGLEEGIQENLNVGKAGLDIVFAVDVSSSIGLVSLNNAKKFIKIICDKFGISKDPTGGKNGTRIALITFSDTTNVIFNLDDIEIRSIEKVKEKVDEIQTSDGETNFKALLKKVVEIYIKNFGRRAIARNKQAERRKMGANRALFIISDGEETTIEMRNEKSLEVIELLARIIRQRDMFKILAIGLGTRVHETILAKIASAPYVEHVFLIEDFKDLERIGKINPEETNYENCGISGNTELERGGSTNKGAYPWLGWITALPYTEEQVSCGGALLCEKWFVTLASCVTEQTENGLQTLEGRINLYLGDHDIFRKDNTEIMLEISEVHIHPNYTGEVNRHNVRPFDIALLKIGKDNTTRPQLNKFIRSICFLESRNKLDYRIGSFFLSMLKAESETLKGEVAGWGHRGHDSFSSKEYFPWQSLEQAKREVQRDETCKRKFPGLNTDMFFCVGNVYENESKPCHGDIGGPLMGEATSRLYAVLGLALKTKGCTDIYDFSIFLNVFHPEINTWVKCLLRGCNRID